jgi:pimeloyl-ACP methyl ester carboxylesterase
MTATALHRIDRPDATLVAQTFGDPANPAVHLVMGATAAMTGWPDAFCAALADRGTFVLRHDHRDTGESSRWPPGAPGYGLQDLVEDTLAVAAALGLPAVHLVGMSLGAWIGQILAVTRPDRLLSLTAIAAEPLGPGDPDAGMSDAFLAHFGALGELDWQDRDAVLGWMVETDRLCARRPFDAAAARAAAGRAWDRAGGGAALASAFNHAQLAGGEDLADRLAGLALPVTVIQGTLDPILPLARAEALARAVPGARLVRLEGAGHELHPSDWATVLDEIAAQVRRVPVPTPKDRRPLG